MHTQQTKKLPLRKLPQWLKKEILETVERFAPVPNASEATQSVIGTVLIEKGIKSYKVEKMNIPVNPHELYEVSFLQIQPLNHEKLMFESWEKAGVQGLVNYGGFLRMVQEDSRRRYPFIYKDGQEYDGQPLQTITKIRPKKDAKKSTGTIRNLK